MTLHDALQESLHKMPHGIAAGYVDLTTGSLLALCANEKKPQEFLNVMTSAVTELFEAPLFRALDKIWSENFVAEDLEKEAFGEILLFGQEYMTLLKRCENAAHAVIYVTKIDTPPGFLLMQVRSNLPAVEASA